MSYRKINIWHTLDWWTVGLYLLFVSTGWFCIRAATYGYDNSNISGKASMQTVWIISSFCIAFVILTIENDWYEMFAFVFYSAMILLLGVTIFIASPIKGSRSWLAWGSLRIQPAEFAKAATALAIAKTLEWYHFGKLKKGKMFSLIILILLPILLILLQNETGSALVFLVFSLVFFREGMSGKILFIGFSSVLFFFLVIRYSNSFFSVVSIGELYGFAFILVSIIVYLWLSNPIKERKRVICLSYLILVTAMISIFIGYSFGFNLYWIIMPFMTGIIIYFLFLFFKKRNPVYLWICFFILYSAVFIYSTNFIFDNILESHQKIRIQVTLGLVDDPRGAGYNINQSKIAIGSGGLAGKGYLKGTQTKLKYVPEQETDFIFCTLGEEKGFIGSVIFVILFIVFIIRLIWLAEKQQRIFARTYGYCVACILFFHFTINIGMVLGLTPAIGIPLPFFSYGGSSLWAFTILLFIFVRLDAIQKNIRN